MWGIFVFTTGERVRMDVPCDDPEPPAAWCMPTEDKTEALGRKAKKPARNPHRPDVMFSMDVIYFDLIGADGRTGEPIYQECTEEKTDN